MKKLIALSIMMLVCGSSISQTDINNKVQIDTSIAKKIGVDLVKGDECKEERKLLKNNISLLNEKVSLKDSIIKDKKLIVLNQTKIIESKDDYIKIADENLSNAKQEIKIYKKQSSLWKVIAGSSILISILTLVK